MRGEGDRSSGCTAASGDVNVSLAVRSLRAAVFAVLCVLLAAGGHVLAMGAAPPVWVWPRRPAGTAAMGDWTAADEANIAYGLNSWHPTPGTRTAGTVSQERRGGRRVRHTDGRLEYHDDKPTLLKWPFPDPMGTREVIAEFTMADVVTIPSHLSIPEVRTHMTTEAARDLFAADTPAPTAADEDGRSDQTFVVDVVVRSGGTERRAVARGRDIYAVSAPLAVEAVHRILTGRTRTVGVASAGEIFDAPDFLRALSPHISLELPG
ncbi:hypothetical protein SAMN02787118_115234 [Streptomyces mirabilis]|uniref:Uncharacterized protein n=1 Tax=Streptomyces mirabilis TaxID=68239 RepID=A0A1I2P6T5_9ACTN|nr:hypothetical protein SAMN02787118_115234 [Streptomyces mirabilis]